MPKQVKCADCGFLGVRLIETRQIVDAEPWTRNQGKLPRNADDKPIYAKWPICFVQEIDVYLEANGEQRTDESLAAVFQKKRICKRHTKWFQGSTPKEHQEMIQSRWDKAIQLANLIIVATVPIISVILSVWLSKAAVTNQEAKRAPAEPAIQSPAERSGPLQPLQEPKE